MPSSDDQDRRNRERAIVVGGAGFIGSHLVDRLVLRGCAVLVVDDLSTGHEEDVAPGAALEVCDISTAPLDDMFRSWRPASVYHLAAQASVPASQQDPLRDLRVNVMGTHRVVEAARLAQARRLVFVSSGGAIYGETRRAATEAARPAPLSYYGVHKLAAEGHVGLGGIPFAIARPSNVYGPRQRAGLEGAVVASFVEQAAAHGSLRIHGDGRQARDFVHVADVVAAIDLLGCADAPDGIWNVASGRSVTIEALARLVERAVGRQLGRTYAARRPGDVDSSAISAGRLRGLGWMPSRRLSDGVRELVSARLAAVSPAASRPA